MAEAPRFLMQPPGTVVPSPPPHHLGQTLLEGGGVGGHPHRVMLIALAVHSDTPGFTALQ